jgi:hypothetical protein
MKKTKILLNFPRYTDAAFENKVQSIIAAVLLNSAVFTSPTPAIAALQAAVKAFGDALIAAANGGRMEAAQKNKCRDILEGLMRQLAGYVTMIAGDDKAILSSSGFDLSKDIEAGPDVVAPLADVVAGINPGEVECNVETVKGAKSYSYEYTADPLTDSSVWLNEPDSRISHLITGLQSGKKYWFRVAAIGLRGARAYSNPVSYYIQ